MAPAASTAREVRALGDAHFTPAEVEPEGNCGGGLRIPTTRPSWFRRTRVAFHNSVWAPVALKVAGMKTLVRVQTESDGWVVTTEAGERFSGRALLLTSPVPQSLELLATGNFPLPEQMQSDLKRIEYAPCLAVLAQLSGTSRIPEPGGLWFDGEPISWMADNQCKGVSSGAGAAVTIHAGPQFSRAHWETPDAEVTATLLAAAAPWLDSVPVQTQLHRWRYSLPLRVHPERCVVVRETAPLAFAGDAFGGPRVEGAALSGLAAGAALAKLA